MNIDKSIKILNNYCDKWFDTDKLDLAPVDTNCTPTNGVTIFSDDENDAFSLNPAVIYDFQPVYSEKDKTNNGICRTLIPYTKLNELDGNELNFLYNMSLIINQGLYKLTKELGDLKDYEIVTIKNPCNEYFRCLSDHSGLELRIFVKRRK